MDKLDLVVVWLDQRKQDDEADCWVHGLQADFEARRPHLHLAVAKHAADLPWYGVPLLFVGSIDTVKKHFTELTANARRMLEDCAYYWILTNAEQESLRKHIPWLPRDRVAVLHRTQKRFNVIRSQLQPLSQWPNLVGLSRGLGQVRSQILRIAEGKQGPGRSVLVLGPSGAGKEEVARALHVASGRDASALATVECGWFTETLLQEQLFGRRKGAYTDATEDSPGLLETYQNGTILLNDFEAAPRGTQAALLGFTNTSDGARGKYLRLGDPHLRESNAWLIFSSNGDIGRLIRKRKVREDFIFRFEDRVVAIRPLQDRPADIPAIARWLWARICGRLWSGDDDRREDLTPAALRWLCSLENRWEGNVRSLRTLLTLAAAMAKQPGHKARPLDDILADILARGDSYSHWVGILAGPIFIAPDPVSDFIVRELLALDESHHCLGLTSKDPKRTWPATGSEKEVDAILSDSAKGRFKNALKAAPRTKSSKRVRESVRLSRIICYAARVGTVNRHDCQKLSGTGDVTNVKDLELLTKFTLLKKLDHKTGKAESYKLMNDVMRERASEAASEEGQRHG
jgi:DNA-binding NtrC family response regulator